MNWFKQNRWLGIFLIVFGICVLIAGYFLFSTKSGYDGALARFNEAAAEKSRLERVEPFPNEANYKKMKVYIASYASALDKMKEELKTRVLPVPQLAPNEFQSHLRQAMLTTAEKARTSRVQLPDNFALGFDEYTTRLPSTGAAPLLGQQLSQIQLIMNILVDAHVDGVSAFTRTPLPDDRANLAATTSTPGGARKAPAASGPKMVERSIVDVTFASVPSAARKVLNQISSANQQFYIIRILHVRNEKDKGPAREPAAPAGAVAATAGKQPTNAVLNFIVGNERLETSARIELIRFTF
jgi:hypothetical protein